MISGNYSEDVEMKKKMKKKVHRISIVIGRLKLPTYKKNPV